MPPWCLIKLNNLTDWIRSPQSSKAQDTPGEELHLTYQRDGETRSACVIILDIKIHLSIQNFLSNCYRPVSGTNDTEIYKRKPDHSYNLLLSRSENFCFLFSLDEDQTSHSGAECLPYKTG